MERDESGSNHRSKHFHPLIFSCLAILFTVIATILVSYITNLPLQKKAEILQQPQEASTIVSPTLPPEPEHVSLSEIHKAPWKTLTVQKNDSLYTVFTRAGISTEDYYALIQLKNAKEALKNLKPKETIYVLLQQKQLEKLIYLNKPEEHLEVIRKNNQLVESIVTHPLTEKIELASGTIHHSFAIAAATAHVPQTIVTQLENIFSWDVNFSRSIQPGDKFAILYEAYFHENKLVKTGDIIAAELINRNTVYQAIRYSTSKDETSYYTINGRNLKHAFLRAPIKYKYISSPFNAKRLHPILQIMRPHEGVDLAAPTGTPIHAAGNGYIEFRGRRGGYGKCIVIHHNRIYTTLYAHMSHFISRYHVGSYVKKGDIIGYVGATGLATGPHLHYEFHVYDIPRDPMTVRLPSAAPVPKSELQSYLPYAKKLADQLNQALTTENTKTKSI